MHWQMTTSPLWCRLVKYRFALMTSQISAPCDSDIEPDQYKSFVSFCIGKSRSPTIFRCLWRCTKMCLIPMLLLSRNKWEVTNFLELLLRFNAIFFLLANFIKYTKRILLLPHGMLTKSNVTKSHHWKGKQFTEIMLSGILDLQRNALIHISLMLQIVKRRFWKSAI